MSDRLLGMKLGLTISSGAVVIGLPVLLAMHTDAREALGLLAVPTVATGIAVGYLFGRRGARPMDWGDRVVQSFGMAFVATAIGDLFVGFGLGYAGADGGADIAGQLLQGVESAFMLWPFGILIFGIVALPVTFGAAIAWSVLMARAVRMRGQVRGSAIHSPSAAPTATHTG